MSQLGISAVLLTPFLEDGQIDHARFAQQAKRVLANGAQSVTIFGTTGEGASVSSDEREEGLQWLIEAGISPVKIIQTIYATAVNDALSQVSDGRSRGVSRFLLVPPFYFKACSEDGLFEWHAKVLADAPAGAEFVLYHIPQITGVALSANLVGRLVSGFPNRVAAVKDSSGNWANAERLLSLGTIPVLVGDERLLHRAVALGAAGAITGMANLYPQRMSSIVGTAKEDPELSTEVTRIVAQPVIPALKSILAKQLNDPAWKRVRSPLEPLSMEARKALDSD